MIIRIIWILVLFEVVLNSEASTCSSWLTCGQCIASRNCTWCSEPAFGRRASRCDDVDSLLDKGCSRENIVTYYSVPEILERCEARCSELRYCVQCQAFEISKECGNCQLNLEIVGNLGDILPNERNCTFKDAEDCSFTFVYAYDNNNRLVIQVLKTRECQSSIPVLWIVVGALAGVILIVLIVYLILRFYIHVQDVKSYKEFERHLGMKRYEKEFKDQDPIRK